MGTGRCQMAFMVNVADNGCQQMQLQNNVTLVVELVWFGDKNIKIKQKNKQ
jgi:hypothetical protein